MKLLLYTLFLSCVFLSCNHAGQTIVDTETIQGTWLPTYEKYDELSQQWLSIKTTVPLTGLKFDTDGTFSTLTPMGSTEPCCGIAGNRYTIVNNLIKFTDRITCPNVKCDSITNCEGWYVRKLEGNILEINQCPDGTFRYKREILLVSN